MSITEVAPVDEYSVAINDALARARKSKPLGEIDPPLASDIIEECIESLADVNRNNELANNHGKSSYAVIETACRNIFYDLLVSYWNALAEPWLIWKVPQQYQ